MSQGYGRDRGLGRDLGRDMGPERDWDEGDRGGGREDRHFGPAGGGPGGANHLYDRREMAGRYDRDADRDRVRNEGGLGGGRPDPGDLTPGYGGAYGGTYGAGAGRYEAGRAAGGYGGYGPRGDEGSNAFTGRNARVERIADGDYDRGHLFGGGMNRPAGEHRGRGPKNYARSDARILEDVNDRLSDDSWLDASEIEARAENGEVTLTGTVRSRDDKRRAEDLAEQVSGVKHVQNNLRVQATPGAADADRAGTTAAATSATVRGAGPVQ